MPTEQGNHYLSSMETRHRFPAPWFRKRDGTYWSLSWAASLIMGQGSPLAAPHRLVKLDKTPGIKSVVAREVVHYNESSYALNTDGSISWTGTLSGPIPPGFHPQEPDIQRIGHRSDWKTPHRVFNLETALGITENGILWSWGRPLSELNFPPRHEDRPFHLLPYSWNPRPIFDLPNGSEIDH